VTVPTVTAVAGAALASGRQESPVDPGKFTPIDIGRHFNCSVRDLGPREEAKALGGASPATRRTTCTSSTSSAT
jgi:hypothetical protein